MRTLLLTAAAAAALASASLAARAQDTQSQSGTVEPRSVKTETIRRPDQPGQSTGQATTSSPGTATAADRQNVQQPSATRRTARAQRHRVAARHRLRPVSTRASRTRSPTTTGQATGRVSSEGLPVRSRPQYARASYVAPAAAVPADRIVLTEPQVANLNAAFAGYIVRMNVWSRPVWEFPATVGATVPGWMQVYGVPAEIVAIYPAFGGDEFLVVGDDIVVLDPGTRRIVAMISRVNNTAVAALPPVNTAVAAGGARPAHTRADRHHSDGVARPCMPL